MVNLVVPPSAVRSLVVPPMAITDGSADPTWVDLPCLGRYVYGRARLLRLPFDAATADIAHRLIRYERRQRLLWVPLGFALMVPAIFLQRFAFKGHREAILASLALMALYVVMQLRRAYAGRNLTVAQRPQLIGPLGIYLSGMSSSAAAEWVRCNPDVRLVSERPRWRRYPAPVYGWAAGLCAVAGVGVWFTPLDGAFGTVATVAFGVLLGAAVILAVKALPAGFIRFGDSTDASGAE